MSASHNGSKPRVINWLFENSAFLIAGAVLALIWANIAPNSYHKFVHFEPFAAFSEAENNHGNEHSHGEAGHQEAGHEEAGHGAESEHSAEDGHATGGETGGHAEEEHSHPINLHFIVNDILMALFFAIAGKEVWESFLPGGSLSNPRKAATPLLATLGGIVGPAGLYLLGVLLLEQSHPGMWNDYSRGWAVPCATDIAFSYLVARIIFGAGHPAIAFLLLLAIADDAAGLVILAIAYPQQPLAPMWFLLTVGAMGLAFVFHRVLRLRSFWWYLLIPGVLSWISFYFAGIHAALGLVPIIPFMPHAHTDLGIFSIKELGRQDTLNEFEHWWEKPVELILGLFGLVNAGVLFSSVGAGTWLVLVGLIVGKPLGITLLTFIADKVFRLQIPEGMNYRHVLVLGAVAGIGFTVALFVTTAAFPLSIASAEVQDSVKMGALGSFGAAVVAFLLAKLLGVKPLKEEDGHSGQSGS